MPVDTFLGKISDIKGIIICDWMPSASGKIRPMK